MAFAELPVPPGVLIRKARPGDEGSIFKLVEELADFERLRHQVTGNAADLGRHLFSEPARVHGLVVEADGDVIGYALFFFNYSTFLTRPGLYLEDVYVTPARRQSGVGKAMLTALAAIADEEGCGRFEWAVLDWNENAIRFYERLGATVMPDWRICRVDGPNLAALASVQNREGE